MNITKENLKEYAEKLMFRLEEEQYDTLLKEFDIILEQMKLIEDIKEIDGIEPMTFPFELDNVKPREDEKIEVIDTEIALSNAKEKVGTEVKVPKVVE